MKYINIKFLYDITIRINHIFLLKLNIVTIHVAEIPDCREDNLDMTAVSPDRMGHCTYLEEDLLKWAKDNNVASNNNEYV